MINKEIKKGDKIWLFSYYIGKESFYVVKSVKKEKTLVSLVVEGRWFNGEAYEVKMYGHASSSILSGYNRKIGRQDDYFTCEYSLIEDAAMREERESRFREAGRDFLRLVAYFK